MTHKIELIKWTFQCGDYCCDDDGTQLIINDQVIDNHFRYEDDFIIHMLKTLKITDYKIIKVDETK